MQRSQTGLLRSLLHNLILQRPNLAKTISPWRWQTYELGASVLTPWTDEELLAALQNFVTKAQDVANIFFLIDGLDEFEGDDEARSRIITLFKKLSSYRNVKVCVSSRPWLIFEDAFESQPSLTLQRLTYGDIKNYVQVELVNHPRFEKLKGKDCGGCSELATTMIERADGVFLWVILVVRDLLQGLRNEDGIIDLRRRLETIPPDLDAYSTQMMGTLDSFYLKQAYQLFEIAIVSRDPALPLMTYSFVHEDDPEYALNVQVRGLSPVECSSRFESMKRRLNSRCKGLLEVYPEVDKYSQLGPRVGFLHRTVRDFLRTDVLRKMLGESESEAFDANLVLCKSLLAHVKTLQIQEYSTDHFRHLLLTFFRHAWLFEFLTSWIGLQA